MMLFPRHRVLRFTAAAWIGAAVVMLALMLLRPEFYANDRAALSVLVPLYFFGFPLGHLGLLACNKLKLLLYLDYHFVPDIASEGPLLWLSLAVLGFVQWFVLLPWVARQLRQLAVFLFKRGDPAAR